MQTTFVPQNPSFSSKLEAIYAQIKNPNVNNQQIDDLIKTSVIKTTANSYLAGEEPLIITLFQHDRKKAFATLLEKGANINMQSNLKKSTVLHLIAGRDINSLNTEENPLQTEQKKHYIDLILRKDNLNLCKQDRDGNTSLHLALQNNNTHLAQRILDTASPDTVKNLIYQKNKREETFFFLLPRLENPENEGQRKQLRKLLDIFQKKSILPDFTQIDQDGNTPLHIAMQNGNLTLAYFIIRKMPAGHVYRENKKGETFLSLLSKLDWNEQEKNNIKQTKKFLQKVNKIGLIIKDDPAQEGQAIINSITEDAQSPLKKLLLFLLKFDPNHQEKDGSFPLYNAVSNADIDTVNLLLQHNANVNMQDHDGNTCLHGPSGALLLANSIDPTFETIIRTLLKAGADPYIKNNKNRNVFDELFKGIQEKMKTIINQPLMNNLLHNAQAASIVRNLEVNMGSCKEIIQQKDLTYLDKNKFITEYWGKFLKTLLSEKFRDTQLISSGDLNQVDEISKTIEIILSQLKNQHTLSADNAHTTSLRL